MYPIDFINHIHGVNMQVKNVSARLYTVGSVQIIPGETVDLDEKYAADIKGIADLEVAEAAPKKLGRPAKEAE